ncbi:membrane protein insertion efficiency factor YidD [Poseidonibacter lekithochrous]|uniref:membrane protein insertion efficiency factor YidD n=1 Tax=Poseidonibacter lekithochrous TaxID=1904463 RepID=UPI0008FC824E|nr:membrane protein insertion efficiency factor YidD [Poseidonibacter lekithochrous]QKJ23916.1 membrane protein insertion efficiency factor, YidD family [Poseidonibacter lekithochrous]
MKTIFKYLIRFYQRYLSVISFGSCRYYPTCSQYALWQLDNNSFFKAIYFTITRVLKCNQLFPGGFDYPHIKLTNFQNTNFKKIKIIYWYIPEGNGKYIVVKNREWKNKNEQYESK